MEKKKVTLGIATGAGKAAAGFFTKAKNAVVNAVDQNGDGELNIDDVSILTTSAKAAIKESSEKWSDKQNQAKREKELKALRPFFEADVDNPDFSLPKLIRIAEMDEKHAESDVCKDSVGYTYSGKDLDVITIYPDRIEDFDLKLYPDTESEMYYVDPADRDHYIALDSYYNYLKIARISELQKIAQDLGAKHFRVTYKEHQKSVAEKDVKAKANAKIAGKQSDSLDAENHKVTDNFSKIEIAAEMECIGHQPTEPKLIYFKKDPQIQSLVSLRLADNQIKHQAYTLNLCNSSGIKIKDAVKIDAAMAAMKIDTSISVTNEVKREMESIFEYEIDF